MKYNELNKHKHINNLTLKKIINMENFNLIKRIYLFLIIIYFKIKINKTKKFFKLVKIENNIKINLNKIKKILALGFQ